MLCRCVCAVAEAGTRGKSIQKEVQTQTKLAWDVFCAIYGVDGCISSWYDNIHSACRCHLGEPLHAATHTYTHAHNRRQAGTGQSNLSFLDLVRFSDSQKQVNDHRMIRCFSATREHRHTNARAPTQINTRKDTHKHTHKHCFFLRDHGRSDSWCSCLLILSTLICWPLPQQILPYFWAGTPQQANHCHQQKKMEKKSKER